MESKKVFVGSLYEFSPEAVSCLACCYYTETKPICSEKLPLPSMGKTNASPLWTKILTRYSENYAAGAAKPFVNYDERIHVR